MYFEKHDYSTMLLNGSYFTQKCRNLSIGRAIEFHYAKLSALVKSMITTNPGICLCFRLGRVKSLWQVHTSKTGMPKRLTRIDKSKRKNIGILILNRVLTIWLFYFLTFSTGSFGAA